MHIIILFGSYARGDWVEDKYEENGTTFEYRSDYDILVVVNDEEKANKIKPAKRLKDKIKRNVELSAPINIIYHGFEYLNSEIENGNYFFNDVIKEGIELYNREKEERKTELKDIPEYYTLAKPKKLHPKERLKKAKLYYDRWFESANDFFETFKFDFGREKLSKAAFELHQATERYYTTALLVFTDYKPKTHELEELDNKIAKLDACFKTAFPRKTELQNKRFTLLNKAYIDARYKLNYEISKLDLEYLSKRVLFLKKLVKKSCEEKIKLLNKEIN